MPDLDKAAPNSDPTGAADDGRSREELLREIARYRAVYDVTRALGGTLDLDANSGEVLNITDAYDDDRFNQEFDKQTGYRTKSVLCCPMNNKNGERIGVIQVLNKSDGQAFNRNDEELLCALAGQAAVAIENAQLYEEQKLSFVSFVETLSTAMDARDPITAGHSNRVTAYSVAIAEEIGYSEKNLEILNVAALLHDIGKIGVPEVVLFKDGKLTDEEYKIIQSHALHTLNILDKIHFDRDKQEIPMMAATHHEWINGKGYPLGLTGDDIPEAGRVMAVADVFDAITSRRHYRDRMEFLKVLNILDDETGTHFQPEFVSAFKRLPVARIVAITEADNPEPVAREDMHLLEDVTIQDLHDLLRKEDDVSAEEKKLLERFNYYYWRNLPEDYQPID
jgi:putative nucleotidyltransferase with HDIG domain